MIIVSNHVKDKVKLDNDVVIRINVAWVDTVDALRAIVEDNASNRIYLDYPEGRTKPPKPTLSLKHAVTIAHEYENVKFFAVSNAEESFNLEMIRESLPDRVEIVPKIETPKGCMNVINICLGADTNIVMLDKEDLYTAVKGDANAYKSYMSVLKSYCKQCDITILEMQGVIFYESE